MNLSAYILTIKCGNGLRYECKSIITHWFIQYDITCSKFKFWFYCSKHNDNGATHAVINHERISTENFTLKEINKFLPMDILSLL